MGSMCQKEMDYYAVLDAPRSATHEELTLAYRKLAVRLCPNRDPKYQRDFVPLANESELTHLSPMPLNRQWEYINMAYDVLGNEPHRTIYDRFGESALLQGIYLPNGYFSPYSYHGDHMKVYNDVFGSYSPYANIIDVVTSPPVLFANNQYGIGVRTRDPPVEKIIYVSLEEVRFGSMKLMHVWREEYIDEDETRTEKRKKTLTLNIKPGVTPGTRYCFKEEGDRHPTKIPADIVFIIADKAHRCFERRDLYDLIYTMNISLEEALIGFRFSLEMLDKRQVKVSITDVVHPKYQKILVGEGLPKCDPDYWTYKPARNKKPLQYGDLIIEFTINFPNYLNRDMKLRCRQFFNELREMEKEMVEKKYGNMDKYRQLARR